MSEFTGLDDLRYWLSSAGFKIYEDNLRSHENMCNWYACRKIKAECRECETNEGKRAQIVATPYCLYVQNAGPACASVELSITGEAKNVWYKLMSYSLSPDELRERLDEIEGRLVAAWNALV